VKIAFLSHLDLNLYLFRLPIMKELIKKNIQVFAICPRGEVFDKFKEFKIQAIEYKIDRSSFNIFKELNTVKNIKNVINYINPDILHTFMHKPNIYGNLTKHKNRINTVTGLGSFFIHNDLKSKIIKTIIENFYKYTTKSTKKVIFQNSDDLKLFVNKKIIPANKAVLIRSSGIDTETFKPIPKNIKLLKELNLDNRPVVLMIARVIKDKGVQEYINAAEILKDKANFLYAGDIDRGNKNAFIPKWKYVKYLGFREDIKELISICDIFVLPSYREGVPRTLLEAAAMAKPIITTDTAGCREVVDNGRNGFLVPIKNVENLVKKIEFLIHNKNLSKEFGINSRKKIEIEFDVKIVVQKYLEVYNELTNV